MGDEIDKSDFQEADFERFIENLRSETLQLKTLFSQDGFASGEFTAGYEIEAWLVDNDCHPTPKNDQLIRSLDTDLVSPELSKFNIELNSNPSILKGGALSCMHDELRNTWKEVNAAAGKLGASMMMIGILPTLQHSDLVRENMSAMERYRALNDQVLGMRKGKPLKLDIVGYEHYRQEQYDVMLEAAATSFQIHLQVRLKEAARFFNAAMIVSAPMVAVGANSPFLFGNDLWDETRIPLFEQSVEVGGYAGAAFGPIHRVTFGSGYIRESLYELFAENVDHFPVLLPIEFESSTDTLPYVRLHNGTIWRWNRPLVGFDAMGVPHLRIEHRVVSAGPTLIDQIANSAFFYGLVTHLAKSELPPELSLSFDKARDNFYKCAKRSFDAHVEWTNGRRYRMQELLLKHLLPMARHGLDLLGIDAGESEYYLSIIEERTRNACHGAAWQRAFVAKYGRDMNALCCAYRERQESGVPVHDWNL